LTCPDGTTVVIQNGKDGVNGANGENGSDGKNGVNGTASSGVGCISALYGSLRSPKFSLTRGELFFYIDRRFFYIDLRHEHPRLFPVCAFGLCNTRKTKSMMLLEK
jgi:hypothetical protein